MKQQQPNAKENGKFTQKLNECERVKVQKKRTTATTTTNFK